ncbi:MAG: ComF family protein [Oxalobacteraceae bacterium]
MLQKYRPWMSALARTVAQRLLPSDCQMCGISNSAALCDACVIRLVDTRASRCTQCGLTLMSSAPTETICGACQSEPPAFDQTLVVTDYAPPIDSLVQDLKFRAQLPLASAFGHMLIRAAGASFQAADVLLPVPLSRERLAQRGFNQAVEIARPLARAWHKPLIIDSCVRTRDTSAQAALSLTQRRVNMRGAFAVRDRRVIDHRHIVVIDDVMTTGHTLRELAACLKRHGAARVSNLVLARTPTR